MRRVVLSSVCVLLINVCAGAQSDLPWTQLSLSTCGVDTYRQANPGIDGSGVVVAVLDTGVDMGIAGLRETPSGEVKVIDVQDFSTQGDIEIARATWNEAHDKIIHYASDGSPESFAPPAAKGKDDGTTVWFGLLKEKAFKNSAVPDVNDNGQRDDEFAICVISKDDGTDDDAVCYVDLDGDRDFSDEQPLKNYKLRYDTFTFPREKKEKQIVLLTCALNIFVGQRKVVLHYDDGGHGTHVAGIAAGYRIQGQEGFDGVAPGAKVISMKIGNNCLAGGATTTGSMKRAFEYAARYSREHNVTVVCNLSFGIGSMREEYSGIDTFVDKLLRKNPNLVICTSAGNEGPGLSSVGTPAAAPAAISVAALYAADTARDVAGVQIADAQLTLFSSRGGELAKPDVATPGMMTSTVPKWNHRGDFWGGTSMASPYAAGLCALLAQHARQKTGSLPRADWIKAALKTTADPVPGFNRLDYGGGQPDITKAAALIETLAAKRANDPLYAFKVSTESPLAVNASSPAAYWRSTHFPTDRPQTFTIKPIFVPQADAEAINAFSKRLMLRSDSDWCTLLQDQIYFRDRQSATVRVEYDQKKLQRPGLYVATIEGLDGDDVALRLFNTVVVPHRVSAETDYRVKIADQTVDGWKVNRHFFAVPPGASAMYFTLRPTEGKESTARAYHIHRPDGRIVGRYPLRLDTKNDRVEASYTISKELEPGLWEVPISSGKMDEQATYELEVRFDSVHVEPKTIDELDSDPGSAPSGSLKLVNLFEKPTTVTTNGRIEGYRKTVTKTLTPDDDVASISLAFTSDIESVRVRIEVSTKDYAKFTDCAVNVFNASGKAIAQSGLDQTTLTITAKNPEPDADSASAKLEIQPAFTEPNVEDSAEFNIKIDYLYAEPIGIEVERDGKSRITLYPGIPAELSFSLERTPPKTPDGMATIGYIRAIGRAAKKPVAEVEIEVAD